MQELISIRFRLRGLEPFARCLTILLTLFASAALAAELPELGPASTLSGTPTAARFLGAAHRSGSEVFGGVFQTHEAIDVSAEIRPEPGQLGSAAEIYVIAEFNGQYFMRDGGGSYLPWDLQLGTLQAAATPQSLSASEALVILSRASLGAFDLSAVEMNFYFAYSLLAAPDELYYSGSPLTLSISDYDPQRLTAQAATGIEETVYDSARERDIPTLIYPAADADESPVILFSHGLGGTRYSALYLAEHWSARGFTVVSMQHAGSDEAIFDVPPSQVLASFTAAASLENSLARIADVSAVLDQLELWNADPQHLLYQGLDLSRVGMSGHSFGAVTTQAVSGQRLFTTASETRDPRIRAAMPLSPSVPSVGSAEAAFAEIDIPWLLMTGTDDGAPVEGVGSDVEGRLAVFPALPEGEFYELVLFEGEHHAFTDREISASQNARNPAHHPIIQALSTAFWDATLRGDQTALRWLRGEGALSVLEPGDSWQFK